MLLPPRRKKFFTWRQATKKDVLASMILQNQGKIFRTEYMKKINRVPFDFVLDRLEPLSPLVKPMFGCHAIYLGERIVLITRKKEDDGHDNGVWIATGVEHHSSLRKVLPSMRPIRLFGTKPSAWQNIPEEADDFEESVLTACEMILKNDPRIGKIPVGKKRNAAGKKKTLRKR